ncbi:hypothetical protein KL929_003982 [Ogataea haglerorum]|nr:hypothetical protein KL929_003982 [Ogataea haglerorum]
MLMMSANSTPPNALSTTTAAYGRQPVLAKTPDDRSQKVRLPSINKLFPRPDQPADPLFQPAQHYVHSPLVPAVYTGQTMFPLPQPAGPAAVAMSLSDSQESVLSPARRKSLSRDSRFKCDQCPKSYTRKHNLVFHKLSVHEKEKLFGCTECQVKFSRSSDLSRHTKEQHSSIVKPFVCGGVNPDGTAWGCGKRFYRKDQLKSHLNTTKAGFKCLQRNFAVMMVPGGPDPDLSRKYFPSLFMIDPSVRLRSAIVDGQLPIVARLLNRYPDLLDNIDPANGWSNLHYAAYHDRLEICDLLLRRIADRARGPTAGVYRAARHTPPPRSYAQITSEDEIKLTFQHDTVIHTACSNNAHRSLELLLAYFSVCIDQRGHHGYTASHVCCVANFALCLGVLLENGAYPNIQDDDGNSPLHLALEYGALDCVDLLVAYKADGQLVNNAGWKPEDLAYDFEVLSRYKAMQTRPPALASLPSLASQPSDAPGPLNAKVSLPSIQHRKFSLSSHASSDSDTDDQYVGDSNSVSTSSSLRLTRDPSPVSDAAQGPSSSNSLASVHEHRPGLARKAPPTPPRKLSIPAPASVTSSLSTQSPASKRSSMSMRNFRSNSQTSESSPMKPQNRLFSRPHAQSSPVVPENEPVPVPASKLSNFRLQNENRVKLGLKLDSMMRSQESLAQEAASEPGVPRVMRSNTEPAADHAQKRSRILSIPIASLRSRKN